jgi:hypothetical protein
MLKVIDWLLLDRETYELARLNRIHEAFNEGKITGEQTRHLVYSFKWKHHYDKIDLLLRFSFYPHPPH